MGPVKQVQPGEYVRSLIWMRCSLIVAIMAGLASGAVAPDLHAQSDTITCEVPSALDAGDNATRDELKAGLEHLVRTYARCVSDGDYTTMSQLVTEAYLGEAYGGGPRMDRTTFQALAGTLPSTPVRFRDFDDMVVIDDGKIRANVKLVVGNQLTFEQMTFIEDPKRAGKWLIDSATPLRVQAPREHSTLEVEIAGDKFIPDQMTAKGPTIDVKISNSDLEDHEFMVLKLDDGATVGALLIAPGGALPAGIRFLAQVTVPGGESTNLVLVNMKPGTYAIVDLLPTESGVPHLAMGMQATLTVTE